jgi:hypothetical protein
MKETREMDDSRAEARNMQESLEYHIVPKCKEVFYK